jgi:hypothetical protein
MTLLNIFRAFRTAKQNRVRVDEPTKLWFTVTLIAFVSL